MAREHLIRLREELAKRLAFINVRCKAREELEARIHKLDDIIAQIEAESA